MKKALLIVAVLLIPSGMIYSNPAPQPDEPSQDERMAWWRDAGFGMFIHWGLYAIPAGEYKGERVRGNAEWIMDKLDIPVKEYEQFADNLIPSSLMPTNACPSRRTRE